LLALALIGAPPSSAPSSTPASRPSEARGTDDDATSPPGTPMTDAGLDTVLKQLDPEMVRQGPMRQLIVEDLVLLVVSDVRADRMRIMTPVAAVGSLDGPGLERLLQANFDAVLDARYAVAQGKVWSVFIHPLSPLTVPQLASGLAQVVVAAKTYGTTYSSGALVFSGGDSTGLQRELYEKLKKKGTIRL
ncbi:MAG: hypothetical protein AAFU79_29160, partial [Myxococcota bacterium]